MDIDALLRGTTKSAEEGGTGEKPAEEEGGTGEKPAEEPSVAEDEPAVGRPGRKAKSKAKSKVTKDTNE